MSLPTQYQEFIHLSRYARWLDEEGRRETWPETIGRYINFFSEKYPIAEKVLRKEIAPAIERTDVMPSMRALMTAGPALDRDNVAGYNCAYRALASSPRRFSEIMYILLCGTGAGFSVERKFVQSLPEVPYTLEAQDNGTCIVVGDSKQGWATAYNKLIGLLYSGEIPTWDTSKVRPSGARLKTFGGRASGPEPLEDLFRFTIDVFKKGKGRQLNALEVHDIVCKIAEIVVVGGVRRSALISLSNLTDERMRSAKHDMFFQDETGTWRAREPQRQLSNNSVCYTEKPDISIFMKEWQSLYESGSGERGIFYRGAAKKAATRSGRRDGNYDFGTNPCSEIILRDGQFCNLSEVVVRPTDSFEQLKDKVRLATILGTLQSTLTDFKFLSPEWKRNCEEERLLGVSLTGIMDHLVLSNSNDGLAFDKFGKETLAEILEELKEVAVETNRKWADKLGINQSSAITCVKPSGTVSQLVDCSSGIHPRHSRYYIRTVRGDKKDPLSQFLVDSGVPHEDLLGKEKDTWVFSFPIEAPKETVLRNERNAIEQLELWKIYATHWCEHKPSITVYVKEDEWLDVQAWVYKNFDEMSGVSFLPYDGGVYKQAPYQECSEEEYNALKKKMPELDWSLLPNYESDDYTIGSQELACTGGQCEI